MDKTIKNLKKGLSYLKHNQKMEDRSLKVFWDKKNNERIKLESKNFIISFPKKSLWDLYFSGQWIKYNFPLEYLKERFPDLRVLKYKNRIEKNSP